jgi:hypothetical protein
MPDCVYICYTPKNLALRITIDHFEALRFYFDRGDLGYRKDLARSRQLLNFDNRGKFYRGLDINTVQNTVWTEEIG